MDVDLYEESSLVGLCLIVKALVHVELSKVTYCTQPRLNPESYWEKSDGSQFSTYEVFAYRHTFVS